MEINPIRSSQLNQVHNVYSNVPLDADPSIIPAHILSQSEQEDLDAIFSGIDSLNPNPGHWADLRHKISGAIQPAIKQFIEKYSHSPDNLPGDIINALTSASNSLGDAYNISNTNPDFYAIKNCLDTAKKYVSSTWSTLVYVQNKLTQLENSASNYIQGYPQAILESIPSFQDEIGKLMKLLPPEDSANLSTLNDIYNECNKLKNACNTGDTVNAKTYGLDIATKMRDLKKAFGCED